MTKIGKEKKEKKGVLASKIFSLTIVQHGLIHNTKNVIKFCINKCYYYLFNEINP